MMDLKDNNVLLLTVKLKKYNLLTIVKTIKNIIKNINKLLV
jgi:hypothetical protein